MEKNKPALGRPFNWDKAAKAYAAYRDIYPESFYQLIFNLGIGLKGQNILDIGTGTGVFPRAMYKYGGHYTAVDISQGQIEQGKRLAAEKEMPIDWLVAPAESTSLPSNQFDVITAIQSWQYYTPSTILPELKRLLKTEGKLLIAHMIWLPFESDIVKASEALVLKYNPDWRGAGYKRTKAYIPDWVGNDFKMTTWHTYDAEIPFTRASWRGRFKACRGIGATLEPQVIKSFDEEHQILLEKISPESFTINHQIIIQIYHLIK